MHCTEELGKGRETCFSKAEDRGSQQERKEENHGFQEKEG